MNETTGIWYARETKITGKQLIAVSAAIIGLLVVVIYMVARINEAKQAQQQARNYNPFTENINYTPATQGGTITFTPNGGEFNKPIKVQLNFEPLKSSRGDVIDADIYYTNNGAEPTKNTMLYTPGQVINIVGEEELTIKARLIAKVGKYAGSIYSQAYTIKPGVISQPAPIKKNSPETEIASQPDTSQTSSSTVIVTDLGALDKSTQEDIDHKTRRILIKVSGIESVRGDAQGVIRMQLSISLIGNAKLLAISGLEVEPAGKKAVIKSQLEKRIQEVKFSPPLLNGSPVEANIRVEFKNFGLYDGNLIIER